MDNNIKKLNRIFRRGEAPDGEAKGRPTDLPLDHRLTFSPQKDEKWTFEEERCIRYNGTDVREIIHENANDAGCLCNISDGLYEYQQHVWSRGGKEREKFNGVAASLQDTVMGRLGTIYDGLMGGLRFECDGDCFWVNNVNVRSVLNLYWLRPTEKARQYLMGLKDKLSLILSRQQSSTRYDGVHDQARELFDDIAVALEFTPPDALNRLTDGGRSA